MPLVHVVDLWLDAHGSQSSDAANPKDHLLRHSQILIAPVETCGKLAVCGRVRVDIGIEHEEGRTADLYAVDLGIYNTPRQLYFHDHFAAVGGNSGKGWRVIEIEVAVYGILPTF